MHPRILLYPHYFIYLFFIIVFLFIATVQADDSKMQAGSFCRPDSGGYYSTTFSDLYYTIGRVDNDSSYTEAITCSVTQDADSDTTEASRVWVINRTTSALTCQLWIVNADDFGYYDYSSDSTSTSSATPQELNFTLVEDQSNSFRYLYCVIPGKASGNRSGLVSYLIIEDE